MEEARKYHRFDKCTETDDAALPERKNSNVIIASAHLLFGNRTFSLTSLHYSSLRFRVTCFITYKFDFR